MAGTGAAHEVRVEPSGISWRAAEGDLLMESARAEDLWWPNQCDMQCRCAGCFVIVIEGGEHLSEMGRSEREALLEQRGRRALEEPVRLACQVSVHGPVTVRKTGVRRLPGP